MNTGVCQCHKCGGIYDDENDCKCVTNNLGEQMIKRYEAGGEVLEGRWVRYEDHAKEVERLRAETESYKKAKQENDERFMIERDEARASNAKLREAIKTATGYMFYACQPNQGDLFAEFDDKMKALADYGEK